MNTNELNVFSQGHILFLSRFVGGEMNTCHNAVDRHVDAGNGDRNAIIYDSPVTNTVEYITYRQLLDRVPISANSLLYRHKH